MALTNKWEQGEISPEKRQSQLNSLVAEINKILIGCSMADAKLILEAAIYHLPNQSYVQLSLENKSVLTT